MHKNTALKTIMYIAIAGILFSGYLSYTELFRGTCVLGGCTNVFHMPACVYGFVMYTIILVISISGIKSDK